MVIPIQVPPKQKQRNGYKLLKWIQQFHWCKSFSRSTRTRSRMGVTGYRRRPFFTVVYPLKASY